MLYDLTVIVRKKTFKFDFGCILKFILIEFWAGGVGWDGFGWVGLVWVWLKGYIPSTFIPQPSFVWIEFRL